jgi:hypothetical protein
LSSIALLALALPGGASAASISITAPSTVPRGASVTLRVTGVAPPNVAGRPAGDTASVAAWVQPVSAGACPAQEPLEAPQGSWGFNHDDAGVTAGAPFTQTWKADSESEAVGRYTVCAWTMDDLFNTAAGAQTPLAVRSPILRLSVGTPRHARVGTRGQFTVKASLEVASRVGIALLPPRAVVCDLSGTSCGVRHLTRCPGKYEQADNLVNNAQVSLTPFSHAAFADPVHDYHGRVRFSARLKALSAGTFHLCAYAIEDPEDGPLPFAEGHAFAAFRVSR